MPMQQTPASALVATTAYTVCAAAAGIITIPTPPGSGYQLDDAASSRPRSMSDEGSPPFPKTVVEKWPPAPPVDPRPDMHYSVEEAEQARNLTVPSLISLSSDGAAVLQLNGTTVTVRPNEKISDGLWTVLAVMEKPTTDAAGGGTLPLPCVVLEHVFAHTSLIIYIGTSGEILRLPSTVGDPRTPQISVDNTKAYPDFPRRFEDSYEDWIGQRIINDSNSGEPSYLEAWKYFPPTRDYATLSAPEADRKWQMSHEGNIYHPNPVDVETSDDANVTERGVFVPRRYVAEWPDAWTARKSGRLGGYLTATAHTSYDAASGKGFSMIALSNDARAEDLYIRLLPSLNASTSLHVGYRYLKLTASFATCDSHLTQKETNITSSVFFEQLWLNWHDWEVRLKGKAQVVVSDSEQRVKDAALGSLVNGLTAFMNTYEPNYGFGDYWEGLCNWGVNETFYPNGHPTQTEGQCRCHGTLQPPAWGVPGNSLSANLVSPVSAMLDWGMSAQTQRYVGFYFDAYVHKVPTAFSLKELGPALPADSNIVDTRGLPMLQSVNLPNNATVPIPDPDNDYAPPHVKNAGRFRYQLINMGGNVGPGPEGWSARNGTFGDALANYGTIMELWVRTARYGRDKAWAEARYKKMETMALLLLSWRHARQDPDQDPSESTKGLIWGSPESDYAQNNTFYFHNNVWAWRGIYELGRLLVDFYPDEGSNHGPNATFGRFLLSQAREFRADIHRAVALCAVNRTDDATGESKPYWVPPNAQMNQSPPTEVAGAKGLPWMGKYANFRFWANILRAGCLEPEYEEAIMTFRESHKGTMGGNSRIITWIDNLWQGDYIWSDIKHDRVPHFLLKYYGHMGNYMTPGTFYASEQEQVLGSGQWRAIGHRHTHPPGAVKIWSDTSLSGVPMDALRWQLVFEDTDYGGLETGAGLLAFGKGVPRRWWAPGGKAFGMHGVPSRYGWVGVTMSPPAAAGGTASVHITYDRSNTKLQSGVTDPFPYPQELPTFCVRVRSGDDAKKNLTVESLKGAKLEKIDSDKENIYLQPLEGETAISFSVTFS